jgi:uncharacterized protein with NRDE domain
MCLLAIFFKAVPDAPLVIGANREEAYARGGEPPHILDGPSRALAGTDPQAGGTWFGVNEHGVVAAVTNRPKTQVPPQPRSRGWLTRDLLGCRTAGAALDLAARELGQNRYAGCNVLCADRDQAFVVHAGDWLRVRPLPPGLHVLTAYDVNDAGDPRLAHALGWLGQHNYNHSSECVAALKELCAQTGNGGPPICLRGKQGGTVSSTIVVLRPPPAASLYLHAQGPPDRTPYADYSYLLEKIIPLSATGS